MALTQILFHRREPNSSNLEEVSSAFDLHGTSMARTSRPKFDHRLCKFALLMTVAVSAALVGVGFTVLIHQHKCSGNQVGDTEHAAGEVSVTSSSSSTDGMDVKSDCPQTGNISTVEAVSNVSTTPSTEKRKRFDLENHKELLRKFPCGVPQRRLINYSDLEVVEDSRKPIALPLALTPLQTVLYRCDSFTGSCTGQYSLCQPMAVEEVELEVKVEDVFNKGKIQTYWIRTWNHTKCLCAPVEPPK